MKWAKESCIELVRLLVTIALVLIGVVWIIGWFVLTGAMTQSARIRKVRFPTTSAMAKETGRSDVDTSMAKQFCNAMEGRPHSSWHPELRNNKLYDGKVTHATIAPDRRRYVYLLSDGSRLMVSHTLVEGRIVVSAKIIHGSTPSL